MQNINFKIVDPTEIAEEIDDTTDTEDIRRHLGQEGVSNTIKYSTLAKYISIFDLLPHDKSYKIILIEQKPNLGHWVCIIRYGHTLTFFDSYGEGVDGELKYVTKMMNKMLGQDHHYLSDLLRRVPDDWVVNFNKKKLQKLSNDIATCGRWVILFITMVKDLMFDLHDFLLFIQTSKKDSGMTGDELVSHWIKG
jgi:hypothetical protein